MEISEEYIKTMIPKYRWFCHVNFGNGIEAKSTSWADAPKDSRHMGISKFEFIVKRNLPDLQGKRILDIGCNTGLIAIHMSRLGAREVVGIDSQQTWENWKEQAEFVKAALEWRCATKYNVKYIDCNMKDIPQLSLGHFDIVTALNCIYYLEEPDIENLVRYFSGVTDWLLVQCNTRDHKRLGQRPTPAYIRKVLTDNGFAKTTLDWPWDAPRRLFIPNRYHRPVVVGHK